MAVKRPRTSTRRQSNRTGTKNRSSRRRFAAAPVAIQEVESLRTELQRLAKSAPARWNADPDEVRKSVLKLVLTLVEFIRQILERQAIRRMETNTLTAEEIEAVGLALMRLEETIRELADQFGLRPEELNLDLGPIGKLV
jgi:regulator of sirC expression with transglutaminase-like and TPR domain